MYKRRGKIWVCILAGILTTMLLSCGYKEPLENSHNEKMNTSRMIISDVYSIHNPEDGRISLHTPNVHGKQIITAENFYDHALKLSAQPDGYSKIAYYIGEACEIDDILVLSFFAECNRYEILEIEIGGVAAQVSVGPEKSAYYVSITNVHYIDYVYLKQVYDENAFAPITVSGVTLVNYENHYKMSELRSGQYETTAYETVNISAQEAVLNEAHTILTDEEYVYQLRYGMMNVYSKKDYSLVSCVSGLGSTRDMSFTSDKKGIVVTSRGSGAYILDISNVTQPKISAQYDALELCTGVDVDGDFAYITSRYAGVEIVDISNIYAPRFVTVVKSEEKAEYQDCHVADGYLYIGVYEESRVDIWDIRDFGSIIQLSSIDLSSRGQGLEVRDGYLFVATGLLQRNVLNSSTINDYGKGSGNGMEIYNVSDPSKPKLCSRVKLDGRMFTYSEADVWDIELSGDYAFISGMGCGMYVYDISDPARPVREAVYNIVADPQSKYYSEDIDDSADIYPYNPQQETHGWVVHTVAEDGCVYLVTTNMGVYAVEGKWCAPKEKASWTPQNTQKESAVVSADEGYSVSYLQTEGSVWAVEPINDTCLAVAAGTEGILIIDEQLNILSVAKTECSVKDLKFVDGYLYTAESEGGIGIYSVDDALKLTKVGSYREDRYTSSVASITVTSDGCFVLGQSEFRHYFVCDTSNKQAPKIVEKVNGDDVGMLYGRNVVRGNVAGKYVGISGTDDIKWYYSENGELKMLTNKADRTSSVFQGMTAVGDYVLLSSTNGYRYWNPEDGTVSTNIVIDSEFFNAKLVAQDDTLVAARYYDNKMCIVDISDLDSPVMEAKIELDVPIDVPCLHKDSIYVPCRHYGLIKITES